MEMGCSGCKRRREQLRKIKERILLLLPDYKGIKNITIGEGKRICAQAGKRVTSEEMIDWSKVDSSVTVISTYNNDNAKWKIDKVSSV